MMVRHERAEVGSVLKIGETRRTRRAESCRAPARREAFTELHREHASGIYNLALRFLGNREDAQDVSQEVLLKAYQRLGKPGELNQRAWLYRVTVNACYDQLRKRKRRPAVSWEPELEVELSPALDGCEQAEMRRHLEEALRRVPPAQRAALLLREVQGLPVAEVASVLGVKATSAEVTLVRARDSFRRHFEEVSGGSQGQSAGDRRRRAPSNGVARLKGLALALGLPGLVVKTVPLPTGLDAPAVVSTAAASLGVGGIVAGVAAKATAAVSTKAAVVAIGATVVAGGAGGVYTAEHAARTADRHPVRNVTAALVSPAPSASASSPQALPGSAAAVASEPATATAAPEVAAVPSAQPEPSAPPTASPSAAPDQALAVPPRVVGEGDDASGSSGSTTTTSTVPAVSPSPSAAPQASPEASPSASAGASPTLDPTASAPAELSPGDALLSPVP